MLSCAFQEPPCPHPLYVLFILLLFVHVFCFLLVRKFSCCSSSSEADRKNLAAHCMGLHRSFDSFGEKQEGNCEGISEHSVFDLTVLREEDAIAARTAFRADVIEGLSKDVKSISSKYFYDDRGSGKSRSHTPLRPVPSFPHKQRPGCNISASNLD